MSKSVLLYRAVWRRFRQVIFDLVWGKSSGRVLLESGLSFDPKMDLQLDAGVVLSRNGTFSGPGRVHIGKRTYLGPFFSIQCAQEITIGRDCLFGNFVSLVDNDHNHAPENLIRMQPLKSSPIRIGDDCWLGEKAIILRGVTIGDHAIVAAGAVVRSNVESYSIVAGVPAKVVSKRDQKESR